MHTAPLTLHLGLGQGLLPEDPDALTPEIARAIAAQGVTRLMTHFEGAPERMAGAEGVALKAILDDAGLKISQYGGEGPNLVVPDDRVRADSVALLAARMTSARTMGAEAIVFGVGSHHPTFAYGPAPENHTPETRARLIACLREIARHAEHTGVLAMVEVHLLTTLDTPEHVREILDEVDSPWVCANYDPVNFLGSLDAVFNSGREAEHAAATIGPRFGPAGHIKDVHVEPDLVLKIAELPPGTGIMDLRAVILACRHLPPGSALIVEHFGVEESDAALRHVTALADELGVQFAR